MRTMRPLTDAQIDTLRSVLATERRLDRRAGNALHRRGLLYVVDQCSSGWAYRATPAGEAAVRDRDDRMTS